MSNLYKNTIGTYKIVLNNRGTNKLYEFTDLEDQLIVPYDYYTFFLNFSELPEDEYEYTVYEEDGCICAKGIIKLKDDNLENVYYDKNREYITYDKQ